MLPATVHRNSARAQGFVRFAGFAGFVGFAGPGIAGFAGFVGFRAYSKLQKLGTWLKDDWSGIPFSIPFRVWG